MSSEMKIEPGKGKIMKGLHIWVVVIFAILVGVAMAVNEVFKSDNKAAAKKTEQPVARPVPDRAATQARVTQAADVAEQKVEQERRVEQVQPGARAEERPTAGPSPSGFVQRPPEIPQSMTKQNQTQAESDVDTERKKQEAMVANSPILAIDEARGKREVAQKTAASATPTAAELQQMGIALPGTVGAGQDGLSPEDKKLLAAATAGDQKPTSDNRRSALDKLWAKDQERESGQQRQSALTEDPASSPYTLFQGTVIPAVLVSRINSDLPGDIIAMVTQDVYDGVTSEHLIFPKGTKIYGLYNNDVNVGQEKVAAAFHRLLFPGGRSLTLGGMPGIDLVGQAGMNGQVNNHFWQMFGSSFLIAGLTNLLEKKQSTGSTTIINTGGSSGGGLTGAGTILSDVSKRVLDRNQNIPPTVTIEQGARFHILVKRDIAIKPFNLVRTGG